MAILPCQLPHGELIASNSLESVAGQLSSLPKGSLVLLDVDNTLIYPADLILRDYYVKTYKELRGRCSVPEHANPYPQAAYCCVEPDSVSWVRSLKERDIHVIAFTAIDGRHSQDADHIPDWRSAQLRDLGFTFSDDQREILFDTMSDPQYGSLPLLKGGVLYSAKRPKGDVFEQYVRQTPQSFPHVVLVDDFPKNLVSVAEKVSGLKIPFTGVWYHRAWSILEVPLDLGLAHRQMQHLARTEKWVSTPPEDLVS